jgi:hypothetical protein
MTLVLLADEMTRTDASLLEDKFQPKIRADRRHTNYRKYDPDPRDGPVFPSVGRASPEKAHLPIQSVYMAWRDR